MGQAARHRRKFLGVHTRCAFCGGDAPETSIEHCPPRAMFQDHLWPEGFEFPACQKCNHGTSDADLLVAMLARMDPFENKGNRDGKSFGLMKAVNIQFPGLFEKMMPTASEARRQNRELKVQPTPGQTHQEAAHSIKVPREFHDAVSILGSKLAKGIYYRDAGAIFPKDGCLLMNWFSNEQLARDGKYEVFDVLKGLAGVAPPLVRAKKYLNDQFEYKLSLSPDKKIMVVQARFGNSFGLAAFGSTVVGHLEGAVAKMREQTSRDGPFTVLQSSSLPVGWPLVGDKKPLLAAEIA